MSHYGDYVAGSVVYMMDTTFVNYTPTDLAGTPAFSVYKDDSSSTETTTGVTLVAPFDSHAGLLSLKIDTSQDGTFYATGHTFHVVLTTGTLGGVSQIGWVVGSFTLGRGNIASYAGDTPQTGDSFAVVKSGGTGDNAAIKTQTDKLAFTVTNKVDANVLDIAGDAVSPASLAKTTVAIGRGTVTSGASTTSVPTSALTIGTGAATGVVADQFAGRAILFDGATTTAGLRGATATISANTASNTPTLTVGTLPATPTSGDLFSII